MPNYKIEIEYDGTNYVGWQRQDNGLSVQECIETAIESLFQEKPTLFGAGRTDSGVHATGQVAHFDITTKELDTYSIKTGLNHYLKIYPISILDVAEVDAEFRLTPEQLIVTRSSAIGPSMGLSMDGYYDLATRGMDLQGVLSPIYILNGIASIIGRKGEGFIGVNFNLKGNADRPLGDTCKACT